MGKSINNNSTEAKDKDFHIFAWIRIVGSIFIVVAVIWGAMKALNYFDSSWGKNKHPESTYAVNEHKNTSHTQESIKESGSSNHEMLDHETHLSETSDETITPEKQHSDPLSTGRLKDVEHPSIHSPSGVIFVEGLIAPIEYELNERFVGWRPNDPTDFLTDNINEYQLGVLEVTRRATTQLTENISRTGSTATINNNLEKAMNLFLGIKAERFMFPSAETSYREAVDHINLYKKQLFRREASFYTRPDNLIPLLEAFEEILGSCDENLVKHYEDTGDTVSTFRADNYFYYAKGVANAMLPMLHAIETEFKKVLETRSGSEILHHAIESCHHAAELDPWLFITEGNLNGILANHRANMAAHMSHGRFYIGLLVETLSL